MQVQHSRKILVRKTNRKYNKKKLLNKKATSLNARNIYINNLLCTYKLCYYSNIHLPLNRMEVKAHVENQSRNRSFSFENIITIYIFLLHFYTSFIKKYISLFLRIFI